MWRWEERRGDVLLGLTGNIAHFWEMHVEGRGLLADTLRWRCFISDWLPTTDL